MERVRADGLEVRVYRGGDGPPLLYLHSGLGEAGRTPFAAALEHHFSVVAPELPGFGASDTPAWHRVEDAVFFLRSLLDGLGWTTGVVAGSSLGGWLAAELAVWYPERVRALALLDPVGIVVEREPVTDIFMSSRERMIQALFSQVPDDLAAALGEGVEGSGGDLALHVYRSMEATARIGWNPYLHDPLLRDRLTRVAPGGVVVRGEADGVTSSGYAEAFAAAVGGSMVTLPGVGHLPAIEAPAATAAALEHALAGVAGVDRS
jgi:pimeloyl-ACP methyl ester carboxylesterase